MENRNYSKNKIKNLFSEKNKFKKNYDNEQFKLAIKNDIIYKIDQKTQLINSQNFEKKIEKYLKTHKVQFYTENDLRKKNIKLTPDFLLKTPIKINNELIHWIDAKNYYGSDIYTHRHKKQGIKYCSHRFRRCL